MDNQDQLLSDDVQEIIRYRPHWIVGRGNLIFLSILVFVITLTRFVKYPDIIKGSMKLVAVNAPKLLIAKSEGKLQRLLVRNEQVVVQGQPLAYLQSTADHAQILDLQKRLAYIEPSILKDSFAVLVSDPWPAYNNLGEVQASYQEFQNTLKETLQVLLHGYYPKKEASLKADLLYLSQIEQNTKQQQQLTEQDYELQQREYTANESLAKDKVIAPLELNQNKSKVIGKQQALEQMSAQLINDQLAEQSKKKDILELQKYITDQEQKFRSALFTLKSKIEDWVLQYVLVAPETGTLHFTSFLQENQLLAAGQELFYVQPRQSWYYGQMMVSQTGLGKLKIGQKVIIRVESYPSSEFGYLTGIIDYISDIPTARDSFLIKVILPNSLNTNYGKTIYFRNNLAAQAEVMTDNRKLFDRFWGQLKDMIRR